MTKDEIDDLKEPELSEYLGRLNLVKEVLLVFMRSFYRQFFHFGYGLDFESLDEGTAQVLNSHFPRSGKPRSMVHCAIDFALNVSENLELVGYGGGDRFYLRSAYCSALWKMLQAFSKDGQDVIINYDEINSLARNYGQEISVICQKSA